MSTGQRAGGPDIMTPTIPFEFLPPVEPRGEGHLNILTEAEGTRRIKWELIGAEYNTRKVRSTEETSFTVSESLNQSLKYHDYVGYSLGNFTEFFIHQVPQFAGFSMKGIEVTFGEATPLAASLFDSVYYEKYFGTWDSIHSIRMYGLGKDDAELGFANAAMLYYDLHGIIPRLVSLDLDFLWEDGGQSEEQTAAEMRVATPIIEDIIPLRFLYSGLSMADDEAACIWLYKVIEYYSTQTNFKAFRDVRHDGSISDSDYIKKVTELVTKDEKGLIYRLVREVASDEVVALAHSLDLIPSLSNRDLADRLYVFRNSIVHGKHSFGFDLKSKSIIDPYTDSTDWRKVLGAIAQESVRKYGKRAI